MANFINTRLCQLAHITSHWGNLVLIPAIAIASLSSCINDDLDVCPAPEPPTPAKSKVALQFNYTYNIKEADAFASEVKNLNVYVFDENGKFFDSYIQSSDKFETGHTMEISDLKDGKYTFVCLARDRQPISRAEGDEMEFSFSSLTPGVSTINDLTEKMGKENQQGELENNKDFAALYTAQTSIDFKRLDEKGREGQVVKGELSLMKCTKTYRIVLLPYENEQVQFSPENFDVRIEGSAAWLDHQGEKVKNEGITYLPYNTELKGNYNGETTVEGKPIDQALVYDLSSSRMFERETDQAPEVKPTNQAKGQFQLSRSYDEYDDKRIIITDLRDKEKPKVVFDHSLPWFLALCGETARNKDWSDQEYLDRQDHYVLTFYVPDKRDYNLDAKVKVNGWVYNLQNSDLGGNDSSQNSSKNNQTFSSNP